MATATIEELRAQAEAQQMQVLQSMQQQEITRSDIRQDLRAGGVRRVAGTILNSTVILAPIGIPLTMSGNHAADRRLQARGFTEDESKRIRGKRRVQRAAGWLIGTSTGPYSGGVTAVIGGGLAVHGQAKQVDEAMDIVRQEQLQNPAPEQRRTARDMRTGGPAQSQRRAPSMA